MVKYSYDKICLCHWQERSFLISGEKVTQLQHAQQAGKHAKDAERPDHIVLGAFLHDVGHLVGLEKNMEQVGRACWTINASH